MSRMKERLGSILPAGWTLSESGEELVVAKNDDVFFFNSFAVPTMSAKELAAWIRKNGQKGRFEIRARLGPALSKDELARLRSENDRVESRLQEMRQSMSFLRRKGDRYLPGSPAERKQVDAFVALQQTLHRLPDGAFAGRSVYLSSNQNYPMTIYPAESEQECAGVLQSIEALLDRA